MWVLQTENIVQNKMFDTIRRRRLNFNKTGVSNLYKFMTLLKSEIYTNDFFPPKNFSCESLKNRPYVLQIV